MSDTYNTHILIGYRSDNIKKRTVNAGKHYMADFYIRTARNLNNQYDPHEPQDSHRIQAFDEAYTFAMTTKPGDLLLIIGQPILNKTRTRTGGTAFYHFTKVAFMKVVTPHDARIYMRRYQMFNASIVSGK